MATTLIKIQGSQDLPVPFALRTKDEVLANLQADYPQLGNMSHSVTTDGDTIVHSFTQKEGTKN